ncbi:pyridoxamine 5'-phosphate oxidase family protein [Litorimonas sp. WD9-15]|uniref:pyridoxamine 5'-phosphate oxidase family protein n=1 Tax=Litorimonas sp. WD9-15 TaxID=3418716 RepID=UPI003D024C3A
MADLKEFKENPQKQLLEQIKEARCVMLGSPNPSEHMQPMSPQLDDDIIENYPGNIYFYSDNTSDLGKAVLADNGPVMLTYMTKDYQACVRGRLYPITNMQLIERFWNPIVASWYPGGKTDPKMMMLRFEMEDAALWASTDSTLKFLYETTKANITDTLPDIGDRTHIKSA